MSKENYKGKDDKKQYHHLTRDQRAQIEILVNEKDENGIRIYSELKHFQKRENIQTIVKWLFFCQFLHFHLAYILRTLYNRDIKVR